MVSPSFGFLSLPKGFIFFNPRAEVGPLAAIFTEFGNCVAFFAGLDDRAVLREELGLLAGLDDRAALREELGLLAFAGLTLTNILRNLSASSSRKFSRA